MAVTSLFGSESEAVPLRCPLCAKSPFARSRCYLLQQDVWRPVRGSYPSFIAHTGSCARPNASHRLQLSLFRWVFAGRCQSLLADSPSRHYLYNPCMVAWTPTPQCLSGAFTRFFPESFGLATGGTSSAHQTNPVMQLQQGVIFRSCSHLLMFRPPCSLDPQVAPTAEV
jgi:hypothetical protein